MNNNELNDLKEQIKKLQEENSKLKHSKKFGLVWEDKKEYLLLNLGVNKNEFNY